MRILWPPSDRTSASSSRRRPDHVPGRLGSYLRLDPGSLLSLRLRRWDAAKALSTPVRVYARKAALDREVRNFATVVPRRTVSKVRPFGPPFASRASWSWPSPACTVVLLEFSRDTSAFYRLPRSPSTPFLLEGLAISGGRGATGTKDLCFHLQRRPYPADWVVKR